MSREKQRQLNRLQRLIDFIRQNPSLYKHNSSETCIVGLGVRLNMQRGKLTEPLNYSTMLTEFTKRYGVSNAVASALFWGSFKNINPRQKDYEVLDWSQIRPVTAIAVLNYIAKARARELSI